MPLATDDPFQGLASAVEETAKAPSSGDTREREAVPKPEAPSGPPCPCCEKPLPRSARICIACGIDVKTGRGIVTAEERNLNETYVTAERIIWWVSWIALTAAYPIASEALGSRKPYATRTIAILTIITSAAFLSYMLSGLENMRSVRNLMLWAGNGEPSAQMVYDLYEIIPLGDQDAFRRAYERIDAETPGMGEPELLLAAHNALPPEDQCFGQYRASQWITHAFLHGGLIHLAGNLLFLMVFGSRINALVGNVAMVLLYPVLAIGAALAHVASRSGEYPQPMLGASGAIMGLAGMYFVFFPLHRMHMAAFARLWPFLLFRLYLKIWPVKGYWVVLFYIASDVIYTARGIEDNVARWAHLGGFIVGVGIALLMLLTRAVNVRGCDLVTAIFGKYAWNLVGKPNEGPGFLQRLP
jgi:membrane associated rhomboid family serine protease